MTEEGRGARSYSGKREEGVHSEGGREGGGRGVVVVVVVVFVCVEGRREAVVWRTWDATNGRTMSFNRYRRATDSGDADAPGVRLLGVCATQPRPDGEALQTCTCLCTGFP